jgi:DHA1 family bicyclomycin/chloramphenicol resistance-like MFS transporter
LSGFLSTPPLRGSPEPSLLLLVFSVAIGSLATHVFVAGMPLAATEFGVSDATMQLSITLSLLGAGIADLTSGPLSDRHGRRPVMIFGGTLFVLASLAAMLAPSALLLIAMRLFQALGASSSRVAARAATRDNVPADRVARRFALVTMAQSLMPIAAPAIGGVFAAWFGWRAIFVFCCVFGIVLLAVVAAAMPESNRNKSTAPGFGPMLASMGVLLRSRSYVGYAVGGSLGNGAFFCLTAVMPFVLTNRLGQDPDRVGGIFLVFTLGVFVGMSAAGWLVRRFPLRPIVNFANLLSMASAVGLLGVLLVGPVTVISLVIPMVLYAVGCGIILPTAMAGALAGHPERAGAAAGLFGFLLQMCGVVATVLAGLFADQAVAAAMILIGASVAAQAVLPMAGRD